MLQDWKYYWNGNAVCMRLIFLQNMNSVAICLLTYSLWTWNIPDLVSRSAMAGSYLLAALTLGAFINSQWAPARHLWHITPLHCSRFSFLEVATLHVQPVFYRISFNLMRICFWFLDYINKMLFNIVQRFFYLVLGSVNRIPLQWHFCVFYWCVSIDILPKKNIKA